MVVDITNVLGDNDRLIVRDDITAPLGEPAVLIEGDDARLTVTRNGSISADDPGNTAVQVNGDDASIFNTGSISGALNGISNEGDDLSLTNFGTITSDSRAVDLSDGDGSRVTNAGKILGTGDQRNGTLYVDGTVDDLRLTNTSRGVIDAGEGNLGDAVSVQVGAAGDASSEDINIVNNGLLQGRGDGPDVFADGERVEANGSSGLRFFNGSGLPEATVTGSVINNGTITAEVNVGFLGGLVVEDGVAFEGRIVNGSRGLISGPRNGLYIGNAEHDLDIINRGRIESGSRAVNIDGSGVNLRNFGDIIGTGNQRNGTVYSDATADDFDIFNGRQGVIDAGEGNQGTGIALQIGDVDGDVVNASIRNDGLIQGRGDGSGNLEGDGIRIFSGVTDGAVILEADIENRGRIVATDDGIELQDGVTLVGDINNRGEILAEDEGIVTSSNSILNGDINNEQGAIIDVDDEAIDINGTLNGNINNQGTITAGDDGVEIDGTLNGNINNQGTITADDDAVRIDGTLNGNLNNLGSINAGDVAVLISDTLDGELNNLGSINADGVAVAISGTLDGELNNLGTLSANDDGIELQFDATVVGNINNRGEILAEEEGIVTSSNSILNGDINNEQGAIIDVNDEGIDVNGTLNGNINNQGTITAGDDGVEIDGTANGDINNQGTITADDDAVRIDGTLNGNINNLGSINAGDVAVLISGTLDGELNNLGTLSANGQAIDAEFADAGVIVNNSGLIDADVVLSNFDDVFDSSQGTVNGTVSGLGGDDLLIGDRGDNILVGGTGNDTLTGGAGADTFGFAPLVGPEVSVDVITDFQDGLDLLDVSAFGFGAADLDAVIAGAQQIGGNVLLTFAPDNTVLLEGVQANVIDTTDFITV